MAHYVLHGVDLCQGTVQYMCEDLPNTMVGLDLARNNIIDEDVKLLIECCPNLQFLDLSETAVFLEIVPHIINGWGHQKNFELRRIEND